MIKRPRGTEDILPGKTDDWRVLERKARELCLLYGYQEVRTPHFEHTELFHRGVGEDTDVVSKEMYTFEDRGSRSITLRPEGTASVVRAFLENKLYAEAQPTKLFYLGPMFRYGRPQTGRLRQFHQFGIEAFGSRQPAMDAEVISLAVDYYRAVGLKGIELHLNSIGCSRCRPEHRRLLLDYLHPYVESLCPTCLQRMERNPLRVLDCKEAVCREIGQKAPAAIDHLCPDCRRHFEELCGLLSNLEIGYILDPLLVRGLDYYTNTAFEFMASDIGAQASVGGGGRYDGLVKSMGGADTPAIGFGLGLERVLLALEGQGTNLEKELSPLVFVAVAGEADAATLEIVQALRHAGVRADRDYTGRSLKAQMKYADRIGASLVVIIGEEEFRRGKVVVRNMIEGGQEEIPLGDVLLHVKKMDSVRNNLN